MIDAPIQQQETTRISLEEFFQGAETMEKRELIDGEVVTEMPSPNIGHQRLLWRLIVLLNNLKTEGEWLAAPMDFILGSATVLQPDIAWVGPQSAVQDDRGKRFIGAPDLAIEILSPGTARYDRQTKYALYERYGTREYWLVDADEGFIEVYVRDALDATRFIRLGLYGEGEGFESVALGQPVTLRGLFEVAAPPAEAPAPTEAPAAEAPSAESGEASA